MPDITKVLAAMGQGTRLDILRLLSAAPVGGLTSGSLAARLNVPLNSMSTHLAVLLKAGLVTAKRSGRHIYYAAEETSLGAALDTLSSLLPAPEPTDEFRQWQEECVASSARPPDPMSDVTRTAWLTELHAAAAKRWSAMNPPHFDESRSSLRVVSDLAVGAFGSNHLRIRG